jgi:uncharacterized membrane protein
MNEVEIPLKISGIGAIKAELRALKGEIANATDPESMAALAMKAGELSDKLKDANEAVATFATGSKFEGISNSFSGIKDSLMSLDFNEAAERAKVFASAMGQIKPDDISKAFGGLTSTIGSIGKAFVSLGNTMLANPIYLIAAVIAGIIAIVVLLMSKLGYLDQIVEGVGVAFDALIEIIKEFGESMGIAAAESEEFKAMQEANAEANKAYEQGAVDAIMVTNEVGTAFEMAASGVISKQEALDIYNEKLGDTFGAATTLEQAEANYIAKTEAYIAATMARARAEVFAKKAAEEQAKALTAKTKDNTTALDKASTWINKNKALTVGLGVVTGGALGLVAGAVTALNTSNESLSSKNKKRTKTEENLHKTRADLFTAEAVKELNLAIEKEKANGITNNGQVKKTKVHKDNSAKRIAEAEKEAKRLYDIEVKANEERIKLEDAQFDLMNELTLSKDEKQILAIQKDYDKKFELANGNAELEKLLTIQQGKDIAEVRAATAKEAADKAKETADKLLAAQKAASDLIFELTATAEEKELKDLQDKYDAELLVVGDSVKGKLLLAEKLEKDRTEIENKYALERIATAETERQAKLQVATEVVNGIAALGNAFIKDQKKLEKFNKASALVQIGIDTAKAISSLVAMSQANPLNAVTAGTAGIAQFASGIVSIITNIAKAKQLLSNPGASPSGDTGGGGGGGDTGNTSTTSATPSINLFGQGNNANSMSSGNSTATGGGMVVTAIVSETQITNVQNKINKINKNAEL